MKKAAVLMIEGYEESETIQIVDLLRRGGVETTTYRFQDDPFVLSMQGMGIQADAVFSFEAVKDSDVIIVPGGRTAWQRFLEREDVMDTLKWFHAQHKFIAGMCSGTKVLEAAGVLAGKKVTGYTGYETVLTSAREFIEAPAVRDDNVITSVGPATPYPFAFAILEALGVDSSHIKERMLYGLAKGL